MAYIQAEWYGRKCLDCGRIEDCEGECSRKGYFRFETVHVIHITPGRKPQPSEPTK